ncbi:replication terminus site-binding protein [Pseudomonas aeruginosa]|nr:DNA replication terminus site-binding protein [Pseudomonas aeruginosa]MBW6124714.1 replication terminus site-binding protein [Pseudomonas aeruginosa]
MHERIQAAYTQMRRAIIAFNDRWPSLVISGVVWRLPLLTEQKTPDLIPVERLEGKDAVIAATGALLAFELELGQAPGTVMRLPGYFVLEESVLEQVRVINALKEALDAAIETTRLELNMIKDARPRIMRRALGANFNTNQLLRKVHAFELPPRMLTFTWAGHTPGTTRILVGQLRAKLEAEAQLRADREHVAIELTPEWQELRSLVNMDDGEHLVQYKKVAPHPRAMLWFSGNSRYDAMIHANLPVFVVAGPVDLEVVELQSFSRENRISPRADRKTRDEAVPRLDIFVPPKRRKKVATPPIGHDVNTEALEKSTYSPSHEAEREG